MQQESQIYNEQNTEIEAETQQEQLQKSPELYYSFISMPGRQENLFAVSMPEGIMPGRQYYIRNRGSGEYLNPLNYSAESGVQLVTNYKGSDLSQRWVVEGSGDNCLIVNQKNTAKSMNLWSGNAAIYEEICLANKSVSGNDKYWSLDLVTAQENGEIKYYYRMISTTCKNAGKNYFAFDFESGVETNNSYLDRSLWAFEEIDAIPDLPTYDTLGISGKTYFIQNKHSLLFLDLANSITTNGTEVLQWSHHGALNQQWVPVFQTSGTYTGYYKIYSKVRSDLLLDLKTAENIEGHPVVIWKDASWKSHYWSITKVNDAYRFTSYASYRSKALYVKDGSTAQGATVCQYSYNGPYNVNSGLWNLTPVTFYDDFSNDRENALRL